MGMKDKTQALLPILSKYDFPSSLSAVFAITSWRSNRGAQESCLALNLAITEIQEWGKKTIVSSDDLLEFYNEIESVLKIPYLDDPITPDFGEIKLDYQGKYYSVITGTGDTAPVFAALQFLERISVETGMTLFTLGLLEYNDRMISHLFEKNAQIQTDFSTLPAFESPSFEYYISVKDFLDNKSWLELSLELLSMMSINNNDIIRSHFFIYKDEYYPLFNPSIIIDYQVLLLDKLSKEKMVNIVISELSNKLHYIYSIETAVVKNVIKKCLLLEKTNLLLPGGRCFTYLDNDALTIFLYCGNDENYIKTIESIQKSYDNESLSVVDLSEKHKDKGYKSYQINKQIKLNIICFDEYIDIEEERFSFGESDKKTIYTAIDLMYMFMSSSEISQIVEFDADHTPVISWGGASDYYTTFLCEKGYISKGALEYDTIYCGIDTTAAYLLLYYIDLANVFPFHLPSKIFDDPECWNIVSDETSVYQFVRKNHCGPCGSVFKYKNGCVVFLSFDLVNILKGNNQTQVRLSLDFFRSISERFLLDYYDALSIIEPLNNRLIQFICDSLSADISDEYINCTNKESKQNKDTISFVVNCSKIEKDISAATDRTIEFAVIKELIQPLVCMSGPSYSSLIELMDRDSKGKKKVDSSQIAIECFFNPDTFDICETDTSELAARKQIALICLENSISPGKYEQREATNLVRKIQESTVSHFEQKVKLFDRERLHSCILSALATAQLSIILNRKGAQLSEGLDESEKEKSLEKSTQLYEDAKAKRASLLYLLETNLFLCDERGHNLPTDNELSELLSYSKWLVHLQNVSDLCYHTDSDASLDVLDDYRIDVLLGSHYLEIRTDEKQRRIISKPYDLRRNDIDKKYIELLLSSFASDTGISFKTIEAVLHLLSYSEFSDSEVRFEEISPNVIKANAEDVISKFSSLVPEETSIEEIKKALEYITVNPHKLKTIDKKKHPILPIWEREKRDNRFEVKPIFLVDTYLIYSPIIIEELRNHWIDGFFQFYPPYEIGLANTCKTLNEWKNHYEHIISSDVEGLLKSSGCEYAKHDVDIRREDRKGHHPTIEVLGDYDVIGLNITQKKIYIIECKFLRPVGSIFEHSNQQKNFFLEDKYDERFQKRIDYFSRVATSYFAAQGFSNIEDFIVEPYMVVNKVFSSYYKPVKFPIVTFGEFEKQLKSYT